MTERKKNRAGRPATTGGEDTSWATVARNALATIAELTAIAPTTLAKLLAYEARDADTPLFSLLVVVKRQAQFWQDLLTALKAGAIAGAES